MRVDLNADVGESLGPWVLGNDAGILPFVTSVSVACGFHAGDPGVMRETVTLARMHQVAIGAHPGLPDLAGFGRRQMRLTPREIEDLVVYQIGALSAVVTAQGGRLQHVKPHGALYNMAVDDPLVAAAIARAIASVDRALILVGLSGSALIDAGREAGLRTASEVFADRGYRADGSLLPRDAKGALVDDVEVVSTRAVEMVRQRTVTPHDGHQLAILPETICIHGDTPGAPALARSVREALERAGVEIRAMGV